MNAFQSELELGQPLQTYSVCISLYLIRIMARLPKHRRLEHPTAGYAAPSILERAIDFHAVIDKTEIFFTVTEINRSQYRRQQACERCPELDQRGRPGHTYSIKLMENFQVMIVFSHCSVDASGAQQTDRWPPALDRTQRCARSLCPQHALGIELIAKGIPSEIRFLDRRIDLLILNFAALYHFIVG